MRTRVYQLDEPGLQKLLNQGKEVLLSTLVREEVITPEVYKEVTENYALIATEPSWLGAIIARFFQRSPNDTDVVILAVRIKAKPASPESVT